MAKKLRINSKSSRRAISHAASLRADGEDETNLPSQTP